MDRLAAYAPQSVISAMQIAKFIAPCEDLFLPQRTQRTPVTDAKQRPGFQSKEANVFDEDGTLIGDYFSDLLVEAGEGFTTVVLLSLFDGGLVVSVRCSQAASRDAAPAKMQMYLFIVVE